MNCTIRQAVGVWDDLVDAYNDKTRYDTHIAEIYSYRLEEYRPGVHKSLNEVPQMFLGEAVRIATDAAEALLGLILIFQEKHKSKITVEGMTLAQWRKAVKNGSGLFHRYHVEIIPRK
jgi:hypothetical protein